MNEMCQLTRSEHKRRFLVAVSASSLILVILLLSSCIEVGSLGPTVICGISQCSVLLGWYTEPSPGGWVFNYGGFSSNLIWWPHAESNTTMSLLAIPLWIPFGIAASVSYVFWRRLHAPLPGHCRKCDYNLTGNLSGVCPECGTQIPNAETSKRQNAQTKSRSDGTS